MPHIMNQFSIYKDTPIISNRGVNETAISAFLVNKWCMSGAKFNTLDCDTLKMRQCLGLLQVAN